jgi:O-acetyl-ADP-ribose deacetylase (regulator of RNase III)
VKVRVGDATLELAKEHGCDSLAFPAISTGVYGYPRREAAAVALDTVLDYLRAHGAPAVVRFVLYDTPALADFERELQTRPG